MGTRNSKSSASEDGTVSTSDGGVPFGSLTQPPVATPSPITPQPPPPGPPTDSLPNLPAPSPMSRALTVSDLPPLMRVLGNAAHYTYTLGTQLYLDPHLVRTLRTQAMGDQVQFLSLVLERRLRSETSPLTLQVLADVISQPPIHDEDLAWRLEQHFMRDVQQDRHSTRTSGTPLSHAMAEYSEHLDAVYEKAAIPPDPKGPPSPSTTYINLAVIKKEETTQTAVDKFTKATLHGGIDQIMRKKKAIELKDIFKPEKGQAPVNFVLVEGAPGVGKSTLAWELCRRRHKIEATRGFAAVVLLRLREKEVKEIKSLEDLLYHDNPDSEQAVARELRKNGGENILLIFDGFDKVPASVRESFYLAKIIRGQVLPKVTVLVTSRPSARADLVSLRKPDKHIEVIGFTRERVGEYASSIFGPNTPILADFLKYISINPSIRSMVYIPLNCAIVVEIYRENREEGRPIPQTMTQLYSELTLTRMRRHFKATGSSLRPRKLETLHQKHPLIYIQLFRLAKLAFEGTVEQEVIFEELPAGCSTGLGLMVASQQLHGSCQGLHNYNFIHLTVQEFLSAFYVTQLPESEQKETFKQCFSAYPVWVRSGPSAWVSKISHMNVVWRFVAGLTGFSGIGWDLLHKDMYKDEDEDKDDDEDEGEDEDEDEDEYADKVIPLLVQYLYEAQEKVNIKSILGGSKYKCYLESVFDCFALGYCIAVSTCSWVVNMYDCDGGPESLEMLVCGLRSQGEVCGYIDSLNIRRLDIGLEGVACFKKMPQRILQQLSRLELNKCKLDGQALDLLSDVVPTMTSLTHLDISENPTGNSGATKLLQTLANTSHLHTLHMDMIPLGRDDMKPLSHLIHSPGGLKDLEIGHYDMQPDCVDLLWETVLSPSLRNLGLWDMRIDMTSVSFTPLKDNCNITRLWFIGATIGIRDISCIAASLRSNTTLKCLFIKVYRLKQYIGHTVQSDASQVRNPFRDLADALKVNRSLKTLYISYKGTPQALQSAADSREAAQALVGAFQYNQTLEELVLPYEFCEFLTPEESNRVGFS